MNLLIAMMGLPRSGKSTVSEKLSKELGAPIVRKDAIRLALHGNAYISLAEPMVKAISLIMVRSLFLSGHPIVIADETHYSRAARDFMKSPKEWTTEFYHVGTPASVCMERAIKTNQAYLVPVIEEMVSRYEPLDDDEDTYKLPASPSDQYLESFRNQKLRELDWLPTLPTDGSRNLE